MYRCGWAHTLTRHDTNSASAHSHPQHMSWHTVAQVHAAACVHTNTCTCGNVDTHSHTHTDTHASMLTNVDLGHRHNFIFQGEDASTPQAHGPFVDTHTHTHTHTETHTETHIKATDPGTPVLRPVLVSWLCVLPRDRAPLGPHLGHAPGATHANSTHTTLAVPVHDAAPAWCHHDASHSTTHTHTHSYTHTHTNTLALCASLSLHAATESSVLPRPLLPHPPCNPVLHVPSYTFHIHFHVPRSGPFHVQFMRFSWDDSVRCERVQYVYVCTWT
mgnify:CR=1 FL=1